MSLVGKKVCLISLPQQTGPLVPVGAFCTVANATLESTRAAAGRMEVKDREPR